MNRKLSFWPLMLTLLPVLSQASPTIDLKTGIETQEDRIQDIHELCRGMKLNYAGFELKKRITRGEGYLMDPNGPDAALPVAEGEAICKAAIAVEQKIQDPAAGDSKAAKIAIQEHNVAFRDRIRALGANFKDTHFGLASRDKPTFIRSGFKMMEIEGRFYVSHVDVILLPVLGAAGLKLTRGDEVLSFGGQSVGRARDALLPYVNASTERAAKMDALDALYVRNFLYPKKGDLEIRIKHADGTRSIIPLRWYFGNVDNENFVNSKEDALLLQDRGLRSLRDLQVKMNPIKHAEEKVHKTMGDNEVEYMLQFADILDPKAKTVKVYSDIDGSALVALRGRYQNTLVIQIRTFNLEKWKILKETVQTGDGKPKYSNLSDYLDEWIKEAADTKANLILDLRSNGGGNPGAVRELISRLLPEGERAYPGTNALALTPANLKELISKFSPETGPTDKSFSSDLPRKFLDRVHSELKEGSFISPLYREKIIDSAGILKAPLSIVTLTGPNCVSACENAVMTLKKNHLATILGRPTSGTGMGMLREISGELSQGVRTADNLYYMDQLPNFYFGAPSDVFDTDGLSLEDKVNERILKISENRPIQPDVTYDSTLKDLMENSRGWLEMANQILQPTPAL